MKLRQMGWMAWVFGLLVGCGTSDQNGYTVLFDQPVAILDNSVSYYGTPVGKVTRADANQINSSHITLTIEPEYSSLLARNSVLVLKAGRLHLTTIAPYGEPLNPDDVLSGFASKTELVLFQLKNIFTNKAIAAQTRAEKLANGISIQR